MSTSPKNIRQHYRQELSLLYPEKEVDSLFYIITEDLLGWDRLSLHRNQDLVLSDEDSRLYMMILDRLAQGEPIQYILGFTWFGGLRIKVDCRVLIPRPETEELCELVASHQAGRRYQEVAILDMGTGSGCIPLLLKQRFPYAKVVGVDVSSDALDVARMNAESLRLEVTFSSFDILGEEAGRLSGDFDVIISNPPYVTERDKQLMHQNVLLFEPHLALFVEDDDPLRYYRAIADFGIRKLRRPGELYLEINERFGDHVSKLLFEKGYEKVVVSKDMRGRDRFVRAEMRAEMLDSSYWYAIRE